MTLYFRAAEWIFIFGSFYMKDIIWSTRGTVWAGSKLLWMMYGRWFCHQTAVNQGRGTVSEVVYLMVTYLLRDISSLWPRGANYICLGWWSGPVNQEQVLAHSAASAYRKGNQSPFNYIIKLRWSEMKHFSHILHFKGSYWEILGWYWKCTQLSRTSFHEGKITVRF